MLPGTKCSYVTNILTMFLLVRISPLPFLYTWPIFMLLFFFLPFCSFFDNVRTALLHLNFDKWKLGLFFPPKPLYSSITEPSISMQTAALCLLFISHRHFFLWLIQQILCFILYFQYLPLMHYKQKMKNKPLLQCIFLFWTMWSWKFHCHFTC